MRVFVTGHKGYIGAHLVELLKQAGHAVTGCDLALLDGRLAGASVSRRGDHFKRWFVPLRPHDVVIFRNRTLPDFRGRGLCPALMRHVMAHELAGDGRAYIDCRVYNKPSICSIEKAGFRRIATMKPLRRKDALGE